MQDPQQQEAERQRLAIERVLNEINNRSNFPAFLKLSGDIILLSHVKAVELYDRFTPGGQGNAPANNAEDAAPQAPAPRRNNNNNNNAVAAPVAAEGGNAAAPAVAPGLTYADFVKLHGLFKASLTLPVAILIATPYIVLVD